MRKTTRACRRFAHSIALSLLLCLLAVPDGALGAQAPGPESVRPGAVLVQFKPGAKTAERASVLGNNTARAESAIPELGVFSLQVPVGHEAETAHALLRMPGVAYAEPDYRAEAADRFSSPLVLPNDPDYSLQWGLAKINAPAAWDVVTGTSAITIAIVDSGVDLNHPDLRNKIWTNPGEIPGNFVDDDGNGKVDDVHGWHFFQRWTGSSYVADENAFVQDDFGHGTHVTGIAAAETNNDVGVAGVSWGAAVMPVKVLDQSGLGWYSDIASGIVYAADNGARVINLSLGGTSASAILCQAAGYAQSKGVVLTAAAGNTLGSNPGNNIFYPGACPHVLAVAATGSADAWPSFSNYGPQVALSAPGVEIYSTWYFSGIGASDYFTKSGTSMAVPHVAGVAALVWSRWPDLSADAVAQQIIDTAIDVQAPGWDAYSGWGRVDAAAAVDSLLAQADLQLAVTATPDPVMAGSPLTFTFTVTNTGPSGATAVALTASIPAGGVPMLPSAEAPGAANGFDCAELSGSLGCNLAVLEPGTAATVTAVYTPTVEGGSVFPVLAAVRADQPDPQPQDNQIQIEVAILPRPHSLYLPVVLGP